MVSNKPIDKGQAEKDITSNSEIPLLSVKGFIMGSADVVPGVSGGTMALILGIYTRFILAIKSVDVPFIRLLLTFRLREAFQRVHWKFGVALLMGMAAAVIFFTRVVPLPILMHTHPELIYGLFFGLILGSVFLLIGGLKKWDFPVLIWTAIGTAVGYTIVTLVPTDTPDNAFFIFFSGALAICSMVLPGISGSFILLVLRKYDTVLGAIGKLGGPETLDSLFILVPFGLGILFGIGAFARLLGWLLKRYHVPTICILIGFMAGSLYIIWPFQDRVYEQFYQTETVSLESAQAMALAETEADKRAPEYKMAGEVINPEAPLEEQKMEVTTVKNKLISSRPFLPDRQGLDERLSSGRKSVVQGWVMSVLGLVLVTVLGLVSRRMQKSNA